MLGLDQGIWAAVASQAISKILPKIRWFIQKGFLLGNAYSSRWQQALALHLTLSPLDLPWKCSTELLISSIEAKAAFVACPHAEHASTSNDLRQACNVCQAEPDLLYACRREQ